jgi:hypothetical protein
VTILFLVFFALFDVSDHVLFADDDWVGLDHGWLDDDVVEDWRVLDSVVLGALVSWGGWDWVVLAGWLGWGDGWGEGFVNALLGGRGWGNGGFDWVFALLGWRFGDDWTVFAFVVDDGVVVTVPYQVWDAEREFGFDFWCWLFSDLLVLDAIGVDVLWHWGGEGGYGQGGDEKQLELHIQSVDAHISCSSHSDAQLAAFFIDPRA